MVKNFGENVTFQPVHVYTPTSEEEVLSILDRHADRQVRVRGSLHSWSPVAATDDVLIDLQAFDRVAVETNGMGQHWADVGGGCVLERLVDELERRGLTLPTIGAVTKQTVAGAIATATHGSGASSLSHYVEAVRVAAYDPDGRARIYEISEGEDLRAARCAVGCLGVVLSIRLRLRDQYWVTETISHDATLADVLANREAWPLQQFMLMPYAWRFVSFNRQVAAAPPGTLRRWRSRIYRGYDQLTLELLSHQLLSKVLLRSSRRGKPSRVLRMFYQHVAPHLIAGPKTTASAVTALTLHSRRHASTQHVEMELFVIEDRLGEAVSILTALTEWCAASDKPFPPELWADVQRVGLTAELMSLRGNYMHHYAFVFRRVLVDDTLISMTRNANRYAIGVFTYLPEVQRATYYGFCSLLARVFVRLLDARLHWGKYFPLTSADIGHLYPELELFHSVCAAVDPNGTFANQFARDVLGLRSRKAR